MPEKRQLIISLAKVDGSEVQYKIQLYGDIEQGDDRRFFLETHWIRQGVVFIESNGGDVEAALNIGRQIRQRGFATEVASLTTCYSAAALLWLGGTPRRLSAQSGIFFHGSYIDTEQGPVADSASNALIGQYLQELEISQKAVRYFTEAKPHDFKLFGVTEAVLLEVEVEFIGGDLPILEETIESEDTSYFLGLANHAAVNYRNATNLRGQTGAFLRVQAAYRIARSTGNGNWAMLAYIIDQMASDMDYWWMENHPGLEHLPYNQEEGVQERAHQALESLGITEYAKRLEIIGKWKLWVPRAQQHLLEIISH